uniref:Galectin n=1 Tax=Globodera pallida TaxID=36090 RepID=A0A183C480_GLOPA
MCNSSHIACFLTNPIPTEHHRQSSSFKQYTELKFILSFTVNGGTDGVGAPFVLDVMAGTDKQIVFYVNGKKFDTVPMVEGTPTSSKLKVYENSHLHPVELGVPYKGDIKEGIIGKTVRWKDGVWGKEENDGPFPFVVEKQFVLEFVAQKDKIEIVLDGKKEYEFKAREDLSKVARFELFGALVLQSVNVLEK